MVDNYKPLPELNFDTQCTDCGLTTGCAVPGCITDLQRLRLIVISDHPGHYEEKHGYPMWDNEPIRRGVGKKTKTIPNRRNAGNYLRRKLEALGLNTCTEVYITNGVKCNPNNNKPKEVQMSSCAKWLQAEFSIIDKHFSTVPIFVAGTTAFKMLKYLDLSYKERKFSDCRKQIIKVNNHPTVIGANPATVCSSGFRMENRHIYHDHELTSVRELPPLIGSPEWHYSNDLALLKSCLQ